MSGFVRVKVIEAIRKLGLSVIPPSLNSGQSIGITSSTSCAEYSMIASGFSSQLNSSLSSKGSSLISSNQATILNSCLGYRTFLGRIYFTLAGWLDYIFDLLLSRSRG